KSLFFLTHECAPHVLVPNGQSIAPPTFSNTIRPTAPSVWAILWHSLSFPPAGICETQTRHPYLLFPTPFLNFSSLSPPSPPSLPRLPPPLSSLSPLSSSLRVLQDFSPRNQILGPFFSSPPSTLPEIPSLEFLPNTHPISSPPPQNPTLRDS